MCGSQKPIDAAFGQIDLMALRMIESLGIESSGDFFAAKEFFELTVGAAPLDGSLPTDSSDLAGFRLAQAALFHLMGRRKNLNRTGILWRGKPDFISDELLSDIQNELEMSRSHAVHDRWGQYLCKGGKSATKLLESQDLRELVETHVGPVGRHQRASCIFYDKVGAHIRPHVDTDIFSVNANLLVNHVVDGSRRSRLMIYPVDGDPEAVTLAPGELVLFYADCIVHSRTPLTDGERVSAISFGFQPAGEYHK